MIYPTISEYIESIKYAEDNFATLTSLRPVLDADGNPVMSSGNFAVVFKMQDVNTCKFFAIKCFTKEQAGRDASYRLICDELEYVSSDYVVSIRYLDKELFVNSAASGDTEFPVLLMDWVEGVTLDRWVSRHLASQYSLQLITHQFCRMASWLMSQSFAHGDLKPDNIIVRDDGSLVLVDYDGMYVPAMQGQTARELGSPDYRHPARTIDDFNEHIDDFSLAAIAMQLAAIATDPGLYDNPSGDTLLLTEADHRNLATSTIHSRLQALLHDSNFERLYALYHLAHAQKILSNVSFRAFHYPKPEKRIETVELSTKVTEEDLKNGIKDEYGAIYSPDGLRLLRGVDREEYVVRDGTRVICDRAFSYCVALSLITLPNSLNCIGDYAFLSCRSMSSITLPYSLVHIGINPFYVPFDICAFDVCGISKILCNSPHFEVDEHALYDKGKRTILVLFDKEVSCFTLPNTVIRIAKSAFSSCTKLTSIIIPNSVEYIGNNAFSDCRGLSEITIPYSVTNIGDRAFFACCSLSSVVIPDSVTYIGDMAFYDCTRLHSITLSNSLTHIGNKAFCGCRSLSFITLPDSVTHIGTNPFSRSGVGRVICNSQYYEEHESVLYTKGKKTIVAFLDKVALHFNIPNTVDRIGDGAFANCENLLDITFPESITHIGNGAFEACYGLTSITLPNSLMHIGDSAFSSCTDLTSITIPNSVTHIDDYAFSTCLSLSSITLPNSLAHIGDSAFIEFSNLSFIQIPYASRSKFEKILHKSLHKYLIEK